MYENPKDWSETYSFTQYSQVLMAWLAKSRGWHCHKGPIMIFNLTLSDNLGKTLFDQIDIRSVIFLIHCDKH